MSPPSGEDAVRTFGAAGSPPVLLLRPWWGITPAVTEWALILFYGGQPPEGEASRTRRVVLHVAPGDEYFTDTELAAVEGGFRAAGSDVQTYRYPGSGHWFAVRGSPGFGEPAFELARSRVIEDLRAAGR